MLPPDLAGGTSTTPGGNSAAVGPEPVDEPDAPVGGLLGAVSIASLAKPSLNLSMLRSSADWKGRSPRMSVRSSAFTTCAKERCQPPAGTATHT